MHTLFRVAMLAYMFVPIVIMTIIVEVPGRSALKRMFFLAFLIIFVFPTFAEAQASKKASVTRVAAPERAAAFHFQKPIAN